MGWNRASIQAPEDAVAAAFKRQVAEVGEPAWQRAQSCDRTPAPAQLIAESKDGLRAEADARVGAAPLDLGQGVDICGKLVWEVAAH